jgi:hypothetical protein
MNILEPEHKCGGRDGRRTGREPLAAVPEGQPEQCRPNHGSSRRENPRNRQRSVAAALRAAVVVALNLFFNPYLAPVAFAVSPGVVDIGPVTVSPVSVLSGQYPTIETQVSIARKSEAKSIVVNIVAVVMPPDHRVKSWSWKTKLSRESPRPIAVPQEYDSSTTGTYRVDIIVYSEDMKRRYALRSRSFEVIARERGHGPGSVPAQMKEAVPGPLREERERVYAGIGLYGNVFNPAVGGTIFLWPSKYLGVQGLYSMGAFVSYEGRLLAKYDLSPKYSVYAGVGYVHVMVDKDIIGIQTRFEDSGVSGAVGVEVALGKKILLYVESSAARIDLERTVVNAGQTVTASVKYVPVTIGCSLVWSLF